MYVSEEQKTYNKAYYNRPENRARAIKRAATWAANNPERAKEIKRTSAAAPRNQAARTISNARWRAANPEAAKAINARSKAKPQAKALARKAWQKWAGRNAEYLSAYRLAHRAEKRASRVLRRALERAAKIGDPAELIAFYRGLRTATEVLCHWCKFVITGTRCGDHYIPLSKGGAHDADNLVPSCVPCNLRKHTKMPEQFLEELALAA